MTPKTLSWLHTILLLIKCSLDLKKARAETDKQITETVCEIILNKGYRAGEERN